MTPNDLTITTTPSSLSDRLRDATRPLHSQAERSGVMRVLIGQRIERADYCLLMRNLHVIYAALEASMDANLQSAAVAAVYDRSLQRRQAIEADLQFLHGRDWARALPVVSAAQQYADRLRECSKSRPEDLIAHAYVRYLGDLNGGQILLRIVQKSLLLDGLDGTDFYRFDVADARQRALHFRGSLDRLALATATSIAVLEEARWAFVQHIALFEQLDPAGD